MNNEQFRKLLLGKDAKKDGSSTSSGNPAKPAAAGLGARHRPGASMTPRSTALNYHAAFARQSAERKSDDKAKKQPKWSAPKGAKLAEGYVDRSKTHTEGDDDRAERIRALEEAFKKEEIDEATFQRLQGQIAGGDLSSTHLVKGLDFKLLERIRRGEDVYGSNDAENGEPVSEDNDEGGNGDDGDDDFDDVLEKEVTAVTKEREKKKGELSTSSLAPGKKRTRDQILADFRAAREAAKAKEDDGLGGRFKKIGAKQMPGSRIERDSKGREVLIIVDEDGHEKRKVRKGQGSQREDKMEMIMPDKNAKPLGMDIPEIYRKKDEPEEEKEVNIFDDAGSDYDPLAALSSGSGSDSDSEDDDGKSRKEKGSKEEPTGPKMPPQEKSDAPRNYFKDSKTGLVSQEELKAPSMADPEFQAAFKKAATLQQRGRRGDDDDEDGSEGEDSEARARREKRKRMLDTVDRDAEDIDMGFGMSRRDDEDDFDDSRVKLSEWGDGDDGGHGDSRGGKPKRKRGPKRRKGDVNSAADVLQVMEQRKAASS